MALQNRVDPFGEISAVSARGTMMGNRGGCMHDDQRHLLRRRWASRQWICCVLEFKGRRRTLMTPGEYTELFFLDEATAMAAGHRPCYECRRGDALRFRAAFVEGNPRLGFDPKVLAPEIDRVLHGDRVTEQREKRTFEAALGELPDGAMVELKNEPGTAWVVWRGTLRRWSFEGYDEARTLDGGAGVRVLTPAAMVGAMRGGYTPGVHPSLDGEG